MNVNSEWMPTLENQQNITNCSTALVLILAENKDFPQLKHFGESVLKLQQAHQFQFIGESKYITPQAEFRQKFDIPNEDKGEKKISANLVITPSSIDVTKGDGTSEERLKTLDSMIEALCEMINTLKFEGLIIDTQSVIYEFMEYSKRTTSQKIFADIREKIPEAVALLGKNG